MSLGLSSFPVLVLPQGDLVRFCVSRSSAILEVFIILPPFIFHLIEILAGDLGIWV